MGCLVVIGERLARFMWGMRCSFSKMTVHRQAGDRANDLAPSVILPIAFRCAPPCFLNRSLELKPNVGISRCFGFGSTKSNLQINPALLQCHLKMNTSAHCPSVSCSDDPRRGNTAFCAMRWTWSFQVGAESRWDARELEVLCPV